MTYAWYKVWRDIDSRTLPSMHRRGTDDSEGMRTMCGIRAEVLMHMNGLPKHIKSVSQFKKFAKNNPKIGFRLEKFCRVCQRVGR